LRADHTVPIDDPSDWALVAEEQAAKAAAVAARKATRAEAARAAKAAALQKAKVNEAAFFWAKRAEAARAAEVGANYPCLSEMSIDHSDKGLSESNCERQDWFVRKATPIPDSPRSGPSER
jgi:hypothetical protein